MLLNTFALRHVFEAARFQSIYKSTSMHKALVQKSDKLILHPSCYRLGRNIYWYLVLIKSPTIHKSITT